MSQMKIGLIGGTGLGAALGANHDGARHTLDTPFGRPSDSILETQWQGLPVYILSRHGPGHLLGPSQVPFRANIFALKQLGVTHILASGAVGSLREEFKPRELVVADQVIDKTYRRSGTFFESAAVHAEFAEPFCPVLRQILVDAGKRLAERSPGSAPVLHDRGCYVCMEGPAFSTRAESLMHRLWGGDLIGMTAMPEAKLAREAEIAYALVALVTDYDCWRHAAALGPVPQSANAQAAAQASGVVHAPSKQELLKEIIENLSAATAGAVELIKAAVELLAERRETLPESPAHRALELAIWSDKKLIGNDEVQRLGPLWIKYLRTEETERRRDEETERRRDEETERREGEGDEGVEERKSDEATERRSDEGEAQSDAGSAPRTTAEGDEGQRPDEKSVGQ